MPNRNLSFTHDSGASGLFEASVCVHPCIPLLCVVFCRFACLDKRQENQECLSFLRSRPPLAAWHPPQLASLAVDQ